MGSAYIDRLIEALGNCAFATRQAVAVLQVGPDADRMAPATDAMSGMCDMLERVVEGLTDSRGGDVCPACGQPYPRVAVDPSVTIQ